MKKIISVLTVLVLTISLFAACGPAGEKPSSEADSFSLATLKGPTTMGLVKLLEDSENGALDYTVESSIYGAAEEISALIISGGVDMAAVPCNLASVLYNKTEGAISVIAINTLGVLNVLELGSSINSIADLEGKSVYSTGLGTTPQYSLNAILRANGLDPETDLSIEYKSEATEIAALLAGESAKEGAIAVLPQPYATTVLAQNPNARIALDLTQEWENAGIDGKLITGVFIVRNEFLEANTALVDRFLSDYAASADWVNSNTAEAAGLIAKLEIVANAAIAEKALPYCSIRSISGSEMKNDISSYLSVLFEADAGSVGGKLPGDDFYYNA